jgi:hypothetical protein
MPGPAGAGIHFGHLRWTLAVLFDRALVDRDRVGQHVAVRGIAVRQVHATVEAITAGVFALLVYLALHYAIVANFYYAALGWESGDPRRLLGDVILYRIDEGRVAA